MMAKKDDLKHIVNQASRRRVVEAPVRRLANSTIHAGPDPGGCWQNCSMAARFEYKVGDGGRGIRWFYEHTSPESDGFLWPARIIGASNAGKLLIYMDIL